jgi:hypothetical protein
MEFLNNPNQAWKFKDIVISKICIVELMKEYGLKLEPRPTGTFSHRTYCPFHKGKGGAMERTPSMFVSQQKSDFHCFSCYTTGSIIDFVSLIDGTPRVIALTKLAKRAGLIDKDGKWDELQADSFDFKPVFDPSKTIEPFLFEISTAMRNYIKMFVGTKDLNKELKWMERLAKKVDEFLFTIGYEDWEYAKEICEKTQKAIENRIHKKDNK